MTEMLQGRRVAILAADGVERVELEKPREALERAGAQTELLSIHDGEIQARENDWAPNSPPDTTDRECWPRKEGSLRAVTSGLHSPLTSRQRPLLLRLTANHRQIEGAR